MPDNCTGSFFFRNLSPPSGTTFKIESTHDYSPATKSPDTGRQKIDRIGVAGRHRAARPVVCIKPVVMVLPYPTIIFNIQLFYNSPNVVQIQISKC